MTLRLASALLLPAPLLALPLLAGAPSAAQDEPSDARELELKQRASAAFEVADYNGNGWISYREARESLGHDRTRFHAYDHDGDGRVTLEEFSLEYAETIRRVGAIKPPVPNPDDPSAPSLEDLLAEEAEPEVEEAPPEDSLAPAQPKASVLELFGQVVPRTETVNASPEPDRIVGPVPSFRRVDYDNDGGITRADLVELARGSGLDPRLNTILASLDLNGDGRVDDAEFHASMRHAD